MVFSLLIIVPTLNSYLSLPQLLDSLRLQSFRCWRLLFVDGPSGPVHRVWLRRICESDSRCSWMIQDQDQPGIFGAMNHGFALASPSEWLLFWGSDDWAADPTVLDNLFAALVTARSKRRIPDIIVCRGRYSSVDNDTLGRATVFQPAGLLDRTSYRRALLLGSTPPHQATLFGPGARQRLASYASGFRLSADLDYFLQLSLYSSLRVQCLDLELVHMGDGGVSGQQTQLRLQEVQRAYRRSFGYLWWFPFLMRYLRRATSLCFERRS